MLKKRTIGNGSLAIGLLLLAVALAKLLATEPARGPCKSLCFAYDLLAHFFGMHFANAASGLVWLSVAALFIGLGLRDRCAA